jgi:diguanylate cyclase (GGDEF)-like protein/PAS domain S-box-containing protein
MENMTAQPSRRSDIPRWVASFVGVVVIAIASLASGPHALVEIAVAGGMTAALAAVTVAAPWAQMPRWSRSLPPFGFFVVIYVLRGYRGGDDSGFNPLTLLPLFWIALYGGRRELWAAILIVCVSFAAPVALDAGDRLDVADWRRAVIWVLVCVVLGPRIQKLVREVAIRGAEVERERSHLTGVLAAATSYAIIGTGLDGLITSFNVGAERMLGYGAHELIGRFTPGVFQLGAELSAISADLDARATAGNLIPTAGDGLEEKRECTYVRRDGSHVPVELTVSEVRDRKGTLLGHMGIAADISERLRAQRELRDSEETVRAVARVARGLPTGDNAREEICAAACAIAGADIVQLWEPDGDTHLRVTASVGSGPSGLRVEIAGPPSGAVSAYTSGNRCVVLDANAPSADVSVRMRELLKAASALFEPVIGRDGPLGVLVVIWQTPIFAADVRRVEAVGLLAAEGAVAIERADMTAQLAALARTDGLTGLANRRTWDERLPLAVAQARRSDRPLCVALIDLDHFKAFNDSDGHQAGDRLLRTAAAAWTACLRETDVLARYGGEEFAVILPNADLISARRVLDRLRISTPEAQTCSVGVAEWDRNESGDELLARADALVYQAKREGRNQVAAIPR